MKRQLKYILILAGSALCLSVSAKPEMEVAPVDSIDDYLLLDEEDMMKNDSAKVIHNNTATGLNVMQYILEDRYRNHGDSFSKKFWDHWYLQSGYNYENIQPIDNYGFGVFAGAHFGLGRQVNRLNSFRLMANGSYGLKHIDHAILYRINAHVDHLFSLSNYFNGYKPDRTLDVSTIFGVGLNAAYNRDISSWKSAPEVHLGTQIKLAVGPRSAFAIEPYAGIGGDQMDMSENKNWKLYDFYYGVNLSFVYFLSKNYSPEAVGRFMAHRNSKNYLSSTDRIPASWRTPWFLEFSSGMAFNGTPGQNGYSGSDLSRTMGNEWGLSIGQWFSTAYGVKFTAYNQQTYWSEWNEESAQSLGQSYYVDHPRQNMIYTAARVEGLINPLGFNKNFRWDRPVDFYFLAGMSVGRLRKYGYMPKEQMMRVTSMGYSLGTHISARISNDLQFFIEPRYNWYVYRFPKGSFSSAYERMSERTFNINAGLTMVMRSPKFRQWYETEEYKSEMTNFSFGSTIGMSLFQTTTPQYDGGIKNFNFGGFAEYRFNHINGVRVNYEQLYRQYYAHYGINKLTFGLASLGYNINLTNAMSGALTDRFFELEASLGPTVAIKPIVLNDKKGKYYLYKDYNPKNFTFGGHLSVKLTAKISPKISAFINPNLYGLYDFNMIGLDFPHIPHVFNNKLTIIETINLGVQYNMNILR